MLEMAALSASMLPRNRPRYLMGVGTPADLLAAIAMGFDMFDCVMPTRNARNGSAFTSVGRVSIKKATHARDTQPLDPRLRMPHVPDSFAGLPASSIYVGRDTRGARADGA